MNSDKLNHLIRLKANELSLNVELVYRNYMFERFLERLSHSKYKDSFIVKGGYLIGSMIGIENRVTKDIDATIRDLKIDKLRLNEIFHTIADIDLKDDIKFEYKSIIEIREKFDYLGYRISFDALFQKTRIHLKMDLTIGDVIIPDAINYYHQCMFDERIIHLKSYALETVLSEKLESIITWGISGSRIRDYYDVFILNKIFSEKLNLGLLRSSLLATSNRRRSLEQVINHKEVLDMIKNDKVLETNWLKFQKMYSYANGISFSDALFTITNLLNVLNINEN